MSSSSSAREELDHYETLLLTINNETTPTLDLHGLDVRSAERELDLFIHREAYHGEVVAQIIHGRGTGKLKTAIHAWLRQHPQEVAYFREALNGQQDGLTLVVLHPFH